ncbi:MAG: MFS transporter [Alphaproteobacteria bacterium]|nr:MFS transporter [Alphaproteobacteria bacterium]
MSPLLVIFLTVLVDLIGFGIVIPLLTFYAEAYGASAMQVTLLMACYSAAQFLFAPLWGALSDRHGRRPVLLLSILMASLMLAGFAWADELWLLFLFRTVHGVFAANISVAQACIADLTTPENRARGMGMLGAAFGLGFTLGPWIGGEFSVYGLSAPIWVAAALSGVNFLMAVVMLPETRAPGTGPARARPIHPGAFLQVIRHPAVGRLITLFFLMTFAFSMMEATFSLFEEHRYGLTARDVGRVLGLIGVVGIVVQGGLIGRLTRRFGELRLVRVGITGLALTLVLLPFAPPWAPLLAVCGLLAVFQGLLQPSSQALISKRTSAEEQGFVLGTNQSLSALARATAPTLGGLLFAKVALGAAFIAGAALLGLGSFVALGIRPDPSGHAEGPPGAA